MSKIIVTVRARDESHNIEKFCLSYADADKILVADGGSMDNTVELAKQFPNVEVREFTERTPMQNGLWRNNDSHHANFLFDWADEYDYDWLIYDDCDCIPNYLLRQDYRKIMEETTDNVIMVTRIYFWGTVHHFPDMAKPGVDHTQYEPTLFAWRKEVKLRTINIPPAYDFQIRDGIRITNFQAQDKVLNLFPPYALLHYSWIDPERVKYKVWNYVASGLIPGFASPLEFAGHLELLEEWMVE